MICFPFALNEMMALFASHLEVLYDMHGLYIEKENFRRVCSETLVARNMCDLCVCDEPVLERKRAVSKALNVEPLEPRLLDVTYLL